MEISTIISERQSLQNELAELTRQYEKQKAPLSARIEELKGKEELVAKGFDVAKIELGRSFVRVWGDPYSLTDGIHTREESIAECAIADILDGCKHLKEKFFGNKRYGGFHQRCDCRYHYGPTYGSIVEEVGLCDPDHIPSTSEEIEASVYYIQSFKDKDMTEIAKKLQEQCL